MNKAAVVLLLSIFALASAETPYNGVCSITQCASVTDPNANACGGTTYTGRVTECPTNYYCFNATGSAINGVCKPAILDNQYGCTRGGQYNQNPIPCADVNSVCNATTSSPTSFGYCVPSTEDSLTLGAIGCQDIGCAPLLVCAYNASYPNQSSIDTYYCALPPYTVGADCSNNGGYCGGSLLCSDGTCVERYSKNLGDSCEYVYECLPGLICAGGQCSNQSSSFASCTVYANCSGYYDQDCECPYATLGGTPGQCTNEWGTPITAAYAAAEKAALDCMFQNCWNARGYADCPACAAQTCAYYDQLALLNPGDTAYLFYPRNSSMFACVEDQVDINGIPLKIDPLYVATACSSVTTSTSSSSSTGNNGNGNNGNSGTSGASASSGNGNTGVTTNSNSNGASSLVISFVSVLSAVLLLL